ncbi:amino acid adenylation domain-containing protein [Thermosporothrix hazakensis]|uniref:Amino acid adenylation domain-containing protein n=2 Tax=Thermosporothrix TaxID=768650 RepID=A0A326U5Q1_THEHA|nr:non-ribosomal peptide synthetase [Thermosporothrix hazakensis]PZW27147.1 amino acid adenylation domain-containing protein [Thermosporothrix hazakensis]BBH88013.1 hypothetical protein KTC_27640 [Thermosporothrix sp. COM3]GCE50431.1 hypothetical protein KTH_53000 [Thermosporothrix hazakensis]
MSIKDELAKKRANLNEKQAALLTRRLHGTSHPQEARYAGIPIRPKGEAIPASFAQQRLWFLLQLEADSATYNEFTAMRIKGQLDIAALKKTLGEIQHRHEILRTSLVAKDRQVQQVIHARADLCLREVDLCDLPETLQTAQLEQLITTEIRTPFDLTKSPLWRVALFKLSETEHYFLLIMHHTICDAWTLQLFLDELLTIYPALQSGQHSPLPIPDIQYADYAFWQQQTLTDSKIEQQLSYWKQLLDGPLPTLDLPTDRPRSAIRSNRGKRTYFTYPLELYRRLQRFNREEHVTLFMTLFAAFSILLSQYTRQDDIIIGTSVAGRTRPELEKLAGLFTNTLPLRTILDSQCSFREVVRDTRTMVLEAFSHQDVPFEKIVAELCPERNLSHNPLFQVMFLLQNGPVARKDPPGLTFIPQGLDNQTAKFDLELDIQETPQGLMGYMEYSTDLFDERTIRQIVGHYQHLLQQITEYPDLSLSRLSLLSAEEKHILTTRNRTETAYPADRCYHALFEEQVRRTPEALAIRDGDVHLTYQELNQRAEHLARFLRQAGVGPDRLVTLIAERGWKLLTAILAIFKAGGAYLPLEPSYPGERLAYILQQSASQLVLTTSEQLPSLQQYAVPIHNIDALLQQAPPPSSSQPQSEPKQLAYVIYTSGSTGRPKGVMIEQRAMINHLFAKIRDLELKPTDRVAQTASQCFDISVWQMLAPLLVGASVEIFSDEVTHNPVELFRQIAQQRITILEIVPALLHTALRFIDPSLDLSALRWLILTGEALAPDLVRHWFARYPSLPMLNAYGPTECADDVTHYPITAPLHEQRTVTPIGAPVANTRLYILNQAGELVPDGIIGELYIGGDGVGRGYLNSPGQTAEAFLPDPFSIRGGERLYKTGDLARWLPDGTLEYYGRVDTQVKIRGYRIEPGEIEAVLHQHPVVRQCVVLAQEDPSGQQQLVAFITCEKHLVAPEPTEFSHFLQGRLPDYMVPSFFSILPTIPLNKNGKIDRHALLALSRETPLPQEQIEQPRTPLEEVIQLIWCEVLEKEQIARNKSFFELGGHSLLAAQAMARIGEIFELDFPLRWLFEAPTIAGLAQTMLQDSTRRKRIEKTAEIVLQVLNMPDEAFSDDV